MRERRGSATAVLAVLAALAGGCGGESERDRVTAYIEEARAVQREHQRDVTRANAVYRELASEGAATADDVEAVATAERRMRAARADLARVRPPARAVPLHRSLLRAYDASADVARDTTRFAEYVPAMTRALRPLEGVGRRLERRLRGAEDAEGQGRALERYAAGLDGLLVRVARLEAPPVLFAVHQAQLLRLRSARDVARRLRRALEAQDAPRTARLVREFRRIGAGRSSARLRKRSIEVYTARLRDVDRAAADVQRERARLDRTLD